MGPGIGGPIRAQERHAQAILDLGFAGCLGSGLFQQREGLRQPVHVDECEGFVQPVPRDIGMAVGGLPEEVQRFRPPALFLEGEAVAGGLARVLRQVPMLQNQHIMGFGADNPEPSPGRYEWRTLDSRVTLMDRSFHLRFDAHQPSGFWQAFGSPAIK